MGSADFAELELIFTQPQPGVFALAMRFRAPGSDADQVFAPCITALELGALRGAFNQFDGQGRPVYGRLLARQLFGGAEGAGFNEQYANFRACLAQSADAPLRLQVAIDAGAAALQSVAWEALQDPDSGSFLATGERIWFSRALASQDPRPVQLRPRAQMRAIAAAAGPDVPALEAVDVAGEIARARAALRGIAVQALPEGTRRATLANLVDLLRADASGRAADILYLACHGRFINGASSLLLEDDQGQATPVAGAELVARVGELLQLPRLVVLITCDSLAREESSALAALGPLFAAAGVPAVLAMHGKASVETVARFMPVFFDELQRHGQIDRAAAAARGAVRDAFDAWMPVLFLRSLSGRLWLDEDAASGALETLLGGLDQPAPARAFTGEDAITLSAEDVQAASTFAHLAQFVDRADEYTRFRDALAVPVESRAERIFAFHGQAGIGKNWLLDRLQFGCLRRGIPCAHVDLEDDAFNNALELMSELAAGLGGEPFARWQRLYASWRLGGEGIAASETPYAKDPRQAELVLSEAFLKALGELAAERPVVLLIDSLDHESVPESIRGWVLRTLLDQTRALESSPAGGVLPVVTMLGEIDYSGLWAKLEVSLYEQGLEPLAADDVAAYFRARGLPDAAAEKYVQHCLEQTGGVPAQVAAYTRSLLRELKKAGVMT